MTDERESMIPEEDLAFCSDCGMEFDVTMDYMSEDGQCYPCMEADCRERKPTGDDNEKG